ncbi:MAG: PPC domain-containing protein [Kofleriaceae bacterium]
MARRARLATWALVVGLGTAWVGCKSGAKGERLRRSSDAAPVEVVVRGTSSPRARTAAPEQEPNDEAAQATPLPLGAAGRGRLETKADVDRYRVTVAKPGALTVTVSPVPELDLVVELRGPSDTVLAKSDRGGANTLEGVGAVPVTAGAYDVVVRAYVKPTRASKKSSKSPPPAAEAPGEAYEVVAELEDARPAGRELEPNEDAGTANDLAIGQTVTGLFGWHGDVDVWKISTDVLAEGDALDFELSAVDGVTPTVELQDGMNRSLAVRKGARGQPLTVRGWRPDPAAAPRFLYAVLRAERSHPTQAYELKLTGHALAAGAELEPNDTPEVAQPLTDEAPQLATWDLGDVDCFELPTAASPRWVDLTVEGERGMNLAIELMVGGRAVATSDAPKGQAEHILGEVPAGAAGVIVVHGAAKPGDAGSYQVRWTQGDAMPPEEGAALQP